MKRAIVFTGGGTAGHVTVNLALMPRFLRDGWDVHYIGSERGIERELVAGVPQVTYHGIATGKLRRYMDWNNAKDPFRVVKGVWQAYRLMAAIRPGVVFSKGGFVSVPVVAGAWLNRIPSIIHESDFTPGLANKLSIPMATKVCTTFQDTAKHLPPNKAVHVGAVVREELFRGEAVRGLAMCDFVRTKPVLLVMGGSLGSQRINRAIREELDALTETFQIVHLCGKGNADPSASTRSYRQFEYVTDELPDLLAAADVVVSRAGSNSIFEFLALKKPMLLIPLPLAQSRGDQIANAESFRERGVAEVLPEETLTGETFLRAVRELYENRARYVEAMEREPKREPLQQLYDLILEAAGTG
ncbi:undecaprenyldiphospho-muramoylpentapeptide beta-N-acetylglucosaminyltransferase [Paenibacillus sp.]|uniref:undecaprenyldiphospho-muramoylpentapeptide beta-N-acetylglucosaminyltransferase n=1 Tax=Paenibacillus sp. TaxID=58172 RepID=UPI0028126264|nr:undecaprenyldiphospho-muramoylpentapeptide beta-N-acetylglucosaminyltransferase [Paenibacillus sp.]